MRSWLIKLSILILIIPVSTFARSKKSTIRGRVVDEETRKPLSSVNVYLSGTTLGDVSDEDGFFAINKVPLGKYDLVVSHIGYKNEYFEIKIEKAKTYRYTITLKPGAVSAKDTIVATAERDEEWQNNYERFREMFLGLSNNADNCEIRNLQSLSFNIKNGNLFVKADRIIHLKNNNLGYNVFINLLKFRSHLYSRKYSYVYKHYFEEIKPDSKLELLKWKRNRLRTYLGSYNHFLASLARGQAKQVGYSYSNKMINIDDYRKNRKMFEFIKSGVWINVDYKNRYNSVLIPNKDSVIIDNRGMIYTDPVSIRTAKYWSKRGVADDLPKNYSIDKDLTKLEDQLKTIKYKIGLEYVDKDSLAQALEQFNKLIQEDKELAGPYYGKGLVFRKRGELQKARKNLRKSIELDGPIHKCYHQVGLIHSKQDNNKKAKEFLQKAVKNDPDYSQAWLSYANILLEGGKIDSTFGLMSNALPKSSRIDTILKYYMRLSMMYDSMETILCDLEKLRKENPDNNRYKYQKAYVLYRMGEHIKSINLLNQIDSAAYPFRKKYLLAKNLYLEDKNTGNKAYLAAINNIKNQKEAEIVYRDLKYLFDEKGSKLNTLAIDSVKKYYINFWKKRSHTKEITENQFISKYYRRLYHCRNNYPRLNNESTDLEYFDFVNERERLCRILSNISGLKSEKIKPEDYFYKAGQKYYQEVSLGKDFLNQSELPEKIRKDRTVDDRGFIYLLYGQPDTILSVSNDIPEIPESKSWLYKEQHYAPKLVFHFARLNNKKGYVLSDLPASFKNTDRLGQDYAFQQQYFTQYNESINNLGGKKNSQNEQNIAIEKKQYYKRAVSKLQKLKRRALYNLNFSLIRPTSQFSTKYEKMKINHDIYTFKGKENRTEIVSEYTIDSITTNDKYYNEVWKIHNKYKIYDNKFEKVGEYTDSEKVLPAKTGKFDGYNEIRLQPGEYYLSCIFEEENNQQKGWIGQQIEVEGYQDQSLCCSDLYLYKYDSTTTIENTTRNEIMSNFTSRNKYNKNQKIGVYFELYNLGLEKQQAKYKIKCQKEFKDRKVPISYTITNSEQKANQYLISKTKDDSLNILLDTNDLHSGSNTISFIISDMNADNKIKKQININLEEE